jgi:methionyl-tRNA synthetase
VDPFYVTTPIYYVNDVPHLGHAYTTIVADTLARFHRARGQATFFLTGTDEHGQKIEEAARKAGQTPKQFADEVVARFQDTWQRLGIANDDFIRTTDHRHEEFVTWLWRRIRERHPDDLYLGAYEGPYCVGCERFYAEGELENGRCPQHPDREVKLVREPSYFFRMSAYAERLVAHIESHPEFILPDYRRNEVLSFVKGGLRDLSISRTSFTWGIPVPDDPKHIVYVWIDALSNYVSALGYGGERYETFWPHAIHLIGKDIIRFHAVYWPTLLMAADLPLPRTIFAHGWWTVRGQKMSKSIPATRIDPIRLAADFGTDTVRYFVLREIPLGLDGDFSFDKLLERYQSDLGNDLGNLLNRTLAMVHKFAGGKVPAQTAAAGVVAKHTDSIRAAAGAAAVEVPRFMDELSPSRALERLWELVRRANQYVDETAPWTLAKRDPEGALPVVLGNFLEADCFIARLLAPFMPDTARAMLGQLGADPELLARWPAPEDFGSQLVADAPVGTPSPIFPRIEKERAAELVARWAPETATAPATAPAAAPAKAPAAARPAAPAAASPPAAAAAPAATPDRIGIEEFQRLDLRVAQVVAAERVPKADKLLKLTVDLGTEQREVVAGIALAYEPEALVGKQVILLANLKPTKIRGILSNGMILAAGAEQVLAVSALDREVPPGTKVR